MNTCLQGRMSVVATVSVAITALALVGEFALAPAAAIAGIPGAAGDLYVSSDALNVAGQYDGQTGVAVAPFASGGLGAGQMAIHFDGTGSRVLIGSVSGGVDEYDGNTGAYIKTYNPGAGWQWAGIYAPNGNVYIGSMVTNDVREYDSVTGAFVRVVTPVNGPSDMLIGPNGDLYICSYMAGYVREVDATTGAPVDQWSQFPGARTNDIAFLPSGEILVTAMGPDLVYRYSPGHAFMGVFSAASWGNTHGITISPWDGNIYVIDGITAEVHIFDSSTYVELNPTFLTPCPGGKIVDLTFKPGNGPEATQSSTWGAVKGLYR
jgi:hypothetical protein